MNLIFFFVEKKSWMVWWDVGCISRGRVVMGGWVVGKVEQFVSWLVFRPIIKWTEIG